MRGLETLSKACQPEEAAPEQSAMQQALSLTEEQLNAIAAKVVEQLQNAHEQPAEQAADPEPSDPEPNEEEVSNA